MNIDREQQIFTLEEVLGMHGIKQNGHDLENCKKLGYQPIAGSRLGRGRVWYVRREQVEQLAPKAEQIEKDALREEIRKITARLEALG